MKLLKSYTRRVYRRIALHFAKKAGIVSDVEVLMGTEELRPPEIPQELWSLVTGRIGAAFAEGQRGLYISDDAIVRNAFIGLNNDILLVKAYRAREINRRAKESRKERGRK